MKTNQLLNPTLLLTLCLSTTPAWSDYYVFSSGGDMAASPALVAEKLGFWGDLGIDIRVVLVADEEDLFTSVRYRFQKSGRHAIDVGFTSLASLARERAQGLEIIPIAQVTKDDVLFMKKWLAEKDPDFVDAFIKGYARAQDWVLDPANTTRLAEIVNGQYYWLRYQADAKPLDEAFVLEQMKDVRLRNEIEVPPSLLRDLAERETAFTEHRRAAHDGDLAEETFRPPRPVTGSAFDDAMAWWRFADRNDYRNYGRAGSDLDLKARGPETGLDHYGILPSDYYNKEPVWTYGGFLNDGFGWAVDGIKKYLTADPERDDALDFTGDLTVWMRCSNRNTRDTTLVGKGPYDSDAGFTVGYQRGDPPAISFSLHPSDNRSLIISDLPLQNFLDVAFTYTAGTGVMSGWIFETETGNLVATGALTVASHSMKATGAPLTIGGSKAHDTSRPLHGNIEAVALWERALSPEEIGALTRGPREDSESTGGDTPASNWHNVKRYGAVGDGKHDDTDAIQAAIDACIWPITYRDESSGRWHGMPDHPRKPGHGYGGVVFIPQGVYRTTRPLVLQERVTVLGDRAFRPRIISEADAGFVWWKGDWRDREIDFKARHGIHRLCSGVNLENLDIKARRFGGHTMGVHVNGLRMRRCRWEGSEAGFVVTGFMMFSEIRDCQFDSLWILPKQGTRFNTSTIENIQVGLHGSRSEDWAVRLEGCIQCVRLSEITFEVRGKGILLDSYAAGITVALENIWNYDTGGPSEVLRVVNGRGISVRNMMAVDHGATIFVGKDVRNIRLENIQAASITFEDAEATRPILSNVSATRHGDQESMIEDDMGGTRDIR
jgi:hypothetical protein